MSYPSFNFIHIWLLLLVPKIFGASNQPSLLFATTKDIRLLTGTRMKNVLRDVSEATGMDFCYEDGILCWTDRQLEVIQCASYNGSHVGTKTVIVKSYVSTPEGLACDWVTNKLYWTDAELNRIEVVSLNGKHRKVLFWDDIDQPRGIVLFPQQRVFFWTDWGETPKIERASMDGSPESRSVIVKDDIYWPNGITMDYNNKVVYWVDGKLKFIGFVSYDGKNRGNIKPNDMEYPYGIAFFRNKVYWTDWKTWSIYECDAGAKALVTRELLHVDHALTDVRIYAQEKQPPVETACLEKNGGCSHLCLLSSTDSSKYRCACSTGIKLMEDGKRCADGFQEFLVVVQRTEICRISLDTQDYTKFKLPLHSLKHAIDVDYDPIREEIYWTDDKNQGIRKASIQGSHQQDVVTTDIKYPDGVAFDWTARNIFWTDTGTDRIQVARIEGGFRKVLINRELLEPRGIAVAPDHGLMFWSDWGQPNAKIERAAMDGTERRALVTENLGWPNGVTLDFARQRVIWCDAQLDVIESVNFAGADRRVLINQQLNHPFGISLLGDFIYWTDWSQRTVERFNLLTNERQVIAEQIVNVMGIKAVKVGEKPSKNPCAVNNGGCNQLCLNRPNSKYICACQIEYELQSDLKTCHRPEASILFTAQETIKIISIKNVVDRGVTVPIADVMYPSEIDFDKNDGRIYWMDKKLKTISRSFINGSDVQRVVEFGLESPQGLAVDWMSENLYWVDRGTKRIEVTKLDGRFRKVLITDKVYQPGTLVVDPYEGYLYWSDSEKEGFIMRAELNGKNPEVFIRQVGNVLDMIIDYEDRALYWVNDMAVIKSCLLDGSHVRTVVSESFGKPIALASYEDRIYLFDRRSSTIESALKINGSYRVIVHQNTSDISDLVVYKKGLVEYSECGSNKIQCSHLCFMGAEKQAECGCPTHFSLTEDLRSCREPTEFLLFSQKNSIQRLIPDSVDSLDIVMPIQNSKNLRAITFDPVESAVYWIDFRANSIKSSLVEKGKPQTKINEKNEEKELFDLALDPYSRLLFWTCSKTNVINVTRIDLPNIDVHFVFKNDSFQPRHIALHSELGLLFWTDTGLRRVVRTRFDGSQIKILVNDLNEPTAIAVDELSHRLYIGHGKVVGMCDLDGGKRVTLIRGVEVASMAVQHNYLYWVTKDGRTIERAFKNDGKERKILMSRNISLSTMDFSDLIAVQFPTETKYSQHPCSLKNRPDCSHLCVTVEESTWSREESSYGETLSRKALCACPIGQYLVDDRQCEDAPTCAPDMFPCLLSLNSHSSTSRGCIPQKWRCDGQPDCGDGSDERDCPVCELGGFRCRNGQCINKASFCDGQRQCDDGSDELQCCAPGHFACPVNNECISEALVCDGFADCKDGHDETQEQCQKKRRDNGAGGLGVAGGSGQNNYYGETGVSTYIKITCVLLACIILAPPLCYYYRYQWRLARRNSSASVTPPSEPTGRLIDPAAVPLSAKHSSSAHGSHLGGHGSSQGRKSGEGMRMTVFGASNGGGWGSYDRSHITGASSSSASGGACSGGLLYPAETLNPPPSPATTRTDSRRCYSAGAGSRYKPYRHYRVINQPPPPTPCSTDVADESDYGFRPQTESEYMSYSRGTASECDSDPFPPPPTPSSCPPSPSSTYFNPLPPPPSPVSRLHH